MRIAIGADHRGYELKRRLIEWLREKGHEVRDRGCDRAESCDYPDHALPVARSVAVGSDTLGVLVCSNGIGMSMVANKVPGVRAALCATPAMASQSRRHNNANVLALGAELVSPEQNIAILEVWLAASFEGGRHARRVEKMMARECRPAEQPDA